MKRSGRTKAAPPGRRSPATEARRPAARPQRPGGARAGRPAAGRLGTWLVGATLLLPPFLVVPEALDSFRLPQHMLAEALALASLLALAIGSRTLAAVPWRRSPALVAALPLLLVAAVSLLTTTHPQHVGDALIDLAVGVAAVVGWSLAVEAPALRRLLDATLVPAALLAAVGILQLHHLWQPMIFGEDLVAERLGITSLAGNPGDLAALLVLPLLVAQAGLPGARGLRLWWRLLALALCAYALVGTQTLTSLVAAAAGSAALWMASLPRRRAVALAAGAVAAALLLGGLLPPLRQRLELAWRASREAGLNAALSGRLDGWRVAARLLREHPLAGVGFGAYRAEFAGAKLRLLREGTPFFAGHVNPSFASAHNEYVEVGADLGWPGLLALAWGVAMVVAAGWRARSRLAAPERALCWGGLTAVGLLALAYFPFRLGPVAFGWLAWMAWMFAGGAAEEAVP